MNREGRVDGNIVLSLCCCNLPLHFIKSNFHLIQFTHPTRWLVQSFFLLSKQIRELELPDLIPSQLKQFKCHVAFFVLEQKLLQKIKTQRRSSASETLATRWETASTDRDFPLRKCNEKYSYSIAILFTSTQVKLWMTAKQYLIVKKHFEKATKNFGNFHGETEKFEIQNTSQHISGWKYKIGHPYYSSDTPKCYVWISIE